MYDLSGKVALVTGAAGKGGLGRAIALRLAQEGANLAVNDLDRAESRRGSLDDVVAEIKALGQSALPVYADVTIADQVERMVADTVAHFGRIDILVNNAGAPAGKDRVPVVELEESALGFGSECQCQGRLSLQSSGRPRADCSGAGWQDNQHFFTSGQTGCSQLCCVLRLKVRRLRLYPSPGA